ncbi:uncharacterized protein LOC128036119 [Gossypium raimondii]|uniref:uncharacterized protein LOC128036119 n=1 Tax=Gossypium raimondii TaxID=29730 RepID=UPI00227C1925|nr:uncharacterized protein LOC128036119 [Gossypium raimondii]
MSSEMIENAIRSDKIDAGETSKRPALRKKESEVNNISAYSKSYSKPITIGPSRQEPNTRPNTERLQFMPIPITYRELYQNLFDAHVVSPFYLKPMQPLYPKWYDMIVQCEYHAEIVGHTIENCTASKKVVERLIKIGIVKLDDPSGPNIVGNPLPNHSDKEVNAIIESGGKRIEADIAEIKTPLSWVWKRMINGGLIKQESKQRPKEGHDIQNCTEFRAMVQNLMNNKDLEFYEEIKGLEEGEVYASEEGSKGKAQKANHPVVIISRPRSGEAGIQMVPKVIIQKPVYIPYNDSKRVPWNYDCNVTIPGAEIPVNTSEEENDVGFYTRSGKRYDPKNVGVEPIKGKALAVEQEKTKTAKTESHVNKLVTESEAREFLKFLKHSEYSIVEQLHKQLARISMLELILSSETHRDALIKVLNEIYVANNISVNKLDRLVNNISADNFIFLSDDEIPPGGEEPPKPYILPLVVKDTCCPGC